MPEPVIIDTTVIQVKSTAKDSYGNLVVTPTEGKDIKLSEKRNALFDIFQQGRTVKLFWAEYMHKKYVSRAELFNGKPPAEKQVEELTARVGAEPLPKAPEHKSSPETGMWWGQLGEMLRCGDIDKTTAEGKHYRKTYYTEMNRVLGITFKEVQPAKKTLLSEAKKLAEIDAQDKPF